MLPLFALFERSIDPDFFNYAFSEQAVKALRLSLATGTMTTLVTILFCTPFAYMLVVPIQILAGIDDRSANCPHSYLAS